MKYLISLLLIFWTCKSPKDSVQNSTTTEIKKDLCGEEFQKLLDKKLEFIKDPSWNPFSVLKKNNEFYNSLKEDYKTCLIGKTQLEIIEIFGKSFNITNAQITYDCIENKEEIGNANQMQLNFKFDENQKVHQIFYEKRGAPIDEVDIIEIDKKN